MRRPNAGWKVLFPRHVQNGIDDIAAIRQEIEGIEAEIGRLTRKRDRAQRKLDIRLGMMRSDVESHDAAISGQADHRCRVYTCTDPSCKMIDFLAAKIEAEREFPLPAA